MESIDHELTLGKNIFSFYQKKLVWSM
jgi:hypothetical protein